MDEEFGALLNEEHSPTQIWQSPAFVIGGVAVSLAFGAVFGLTRCFGTCK